MGLTTTQLASPVHVGLTISLWASPVHLGHNHLTLVFIATPWHSPLHCGPHQYTLGLTTALWASPLHRGPQCYIVGLTVDRREFPVASHGGIATEGEVEAPAMLGPVAVSRCQHQRLLLPAGGTQVLPGVVAHQHRAIVIYVQDLHCHQRGC